jgi:hypothetical protein
VRLINDGPKLGNKHLYRNKSVEKNICFSVFFVKQDIITCSDKELQHQIDQPKEIRIMDIII